MTIRLLLLTIVAFGSGCGLYFGDGGSTNPPIDASTTPPPPPPMCMPPSPLCNTNGICGNGIIDTCYVPVMPGGNHCWFYPVPEQCDGPPTTSCTDAGFYSGTSTCNNCMSISYAGCAACSPADLSCETVDPLDFQHRLAVSGSRVALLSDYEAAIFEGTTEIIRTNVPYGSGIVAVPGGWLVTMSYFPRTVAFLDSAGTLGTEIEIPDAAGYPLLASGPSGRVLLAWMDSDTTMTPAQWHVYAAILDTAGNSVVPAADLFTTTGGSQVGITSDGTAFFVGSNGKLARIAADGSTTLVTGFPITPNSTEDYVTITWGGTTGWYIDNGGSAVQRFDASGAKVGSVFAIASANTYVGDGDELLALRRDPNKTSGIQVMRIDQSGLLVGSPKEVGITEGYVESLARLGTNIFVAWSRPTQLQVALTTPP